MKSEDELGEFRRAQDELDQVRQLADDIRMRGNSAVHKATPKNKMFTVTVGGRGEVQDITFRASAYRSLAPAELGKLLVETIEEARSQAIAAGMASIAELTPNAALPLDLMNPASTMDDLMDSLLDAAGRSMPNVAPDDIPRRRELP
ncbi:YbaB/EbfC family nucleoid-associated protein [Kineosporia succinea]|uniref:DNA-binding protein YbaB n=1 Tax=Kineosporia succinea TaxID=84632 RepID=A0ABT9P5M9_9ACTN|nr:YbaB/EbfC family nucleoid-associated protein [Kineosporia succinea]MDP9827777.1 DNA-binding protein YbaB [Kineosporia succinea]